MNLYNCTLLPSLHYYVFEHQEDWDTYIQLLTYTYITPTHKVTETSPFNVILRKKPLLGAKLDRLTSPASYMQRDVPPPHMTHWLQQRIKLMKIAFSLRLSMVQRRYERHFDKNVRQKPTVKVTDYEFIDRPPQTLIVKDAVYEMANRRYNNIVRANVWHVQITRLSVPYCNNSE